MKRKVFILATLLIACSSFMYALDKQALADSLTVYTKQYAAVGKVIVNKVQVKNNQANVYTNQALSCIPIDAQRVKEIRAIAAHFIFANGKGQVKIYSDGYEIGELVYNKKTHGAWKLPTFTPIVRNVSAPYEISKGLNGKQIALWGSHGIYYFQARQDWIWQRAKVLTTVEDIYTTSYTMPFLVPMLENAGAVVFQPRERDTQLTEYLIDNVDVNLPNGWQNNTDAGWGAPKYGVLLEHDNPFLMGNYAQAKAVNENAATEVVYTIPITAETEGDYAVYVSYKSLKNSTEAALYTVAHTNEETVFKVNQTMGGGTWIYLGTFHFAPNAKNEIRVSNAGKNKTVVTTDAVKIGGGMGSVARFASKEITENIKSADLKEEDVRQATSDFVHAHYDSLLRVATTSNYPRWIEGARCWLQYAGVPDSVYNFTGSTNDYTDDYASRGRWVNYLIGGSFLYPNHPGFGIPIHLSMAFHTDAGTTRNDDIIGTLAIYTDHNNDNQKVHPNGVSRMACRNLTEWVQNYIVNDVREIFAPEWKRRQLWNSSYAESRNPEMPSFLLELLSHQNFADLRYGLDPRFRFVVSRAIYKGMLRFLHEQEGTPYIVQPLPVEQFAVAMTDETHLHLSWKAREDSQEPTAVPTYYVVYQRRNGGDWDNGKIVKTNAYDLTIEQDVQYDFRVLAGNAGGVSMDSEILSAYSARESKGKILIINAFERVAAAESFEIDSLYAGFNPMSYPVGYKKEINHIGQQYDFDRTHPWVSDDDSGFGSSYVDQAKHLMAGNTFDYPCLHGMALAEMGYSYVSTSAKAVSTINEYDAVDIIWGKQKETTLGTVKQTIDFQLLTPDLAAALTTFAANGGHILASGAYIGSEIFKTEYGKQYQDFAKNVLHITYGTHHASKTGKVRFVEPQIGISESQFEMNASPTFFCENPEAFKTPDGKVAARYADTEAAAAIYYEGDARSLVYGFPLEAAENFVSIYKSSIEWLLK